MIKKKIEEGTLQQQLDFPYSISPSLRKVGELNPNT